MKFVEVKDNYIAILLHKWDAEDLRFSVTTRNPEFNAYMHSEIKEQIDAQLKENSDED